MNEEIIKNMQKHNKELSAYACKDESAIRLKPFSKNFRTAFFRDSDKVIYSLSYARYIDKTQVFTNPNNDMISKRITHVQLVSKIARTIGRALNLNEDLIEAAGLGHDLGHVPFGHLGEKILNKLSLKYNEGYFNHNVQSVRTLMRLENYGEGNNISVQVLDAILCHNGEIIKGEYSPTHKTKEQFLEEYNACYKDKEMSKKLKPMTLEGCVVRISDVIAYIGKDIEDAVRLNKLKYSDIPDDIASVLGNSNSEIVNTIVCDIINNSYSKNSISLSTEIFEALNKLLKFNYKNIYALAYTDEQVKSIEDKFSKLFDLYYNQIVNEDKSSDIYVSYLSEMSKDYNDSETPARKVIDYIAGMTDDFFEYQYNKYFK